MGLRLEWKTTGIGASPLDAWLAVVAGGWFRLPPTSALAVRLDAPGRVGRGAVRAMVALRAEAWLCRELAGAPASRVPATASAIRRSSATAATSGRREPSLVAVTACRGAGRVWPKRRQPDASPRLLRRSKSLSDEGSSASLRDGPSAPCCLVSDGHPQARTFDFSNK